MASELLENLVNALTYINGTEVPPNPNWESHFLQEVDTFMSGVDLFSNLEISYTNGWVIRLYANEKTLNLSVVALTSLAPRRLVTGIEDEVRYSYQRLGIETLVCHIKGNPEELLALTSGEIHRNPFINGHFNLNAASTTYLATTTGAMALGKVPGGGGKDDQIIPHVSRWGLAEMRWYEERMEAADVFRRCFEAFASANPTDYSAVWP